MSRGGGAPPGTSVGLIAATPGLHSSFTAQGLADAGVPDNTAVVNWPDRSGNNHNLRQITSSGRRPKLQTAEISGQAAMEWDGTDDTMVPYASTEFDFLHQGPWTWIGVVKLDAALAADCFLFSSAPISASNTGVALQYQTTNSKLRCAIYSRGGSAIVCDAVSGNNAISLGVAHTVVVKVQPAASGSDMIVEVDGVSVATADFTADPDAGGSNTGGTSTPFTMGANANTSGNNLKGMLCESHFFTRRLTDAEVSAIVGAARSTYGI